MAKHPGERLRFRGGKRDARLEQVNRGEVVMERKYAPMMSDWPELTGAEARHFANLRRVVFLLSFLGFMALIGTRLVSEYWLLRTLTGLLAGLSLLTASLIVVSRVHQGPRMACWAMVAASTLGLVSEMMKMGADLVPVYAGILDTCANFSLITCVSGWVCFMNPALFEMAMGRIRLSRESEKLLEANETSRRSERRYQALFESASEAICVANPQSGAILESNQSACDLFGYSRGELSETSMELLFGTAIAEVREGLACALEGETARLYDLEIPRKDGKKARIDLSVSLLPEGEALLLARDMTQRKEVEERLQRIQNFESIGRLAGGVAHDFNNVLTPILGFAELLLEEAPPEHPWHRDLKEIADAAEHAKHLTQQLLAVGRRQTLNIRTIDLGETVADFQNVIRRTIRENIAIEVDAPPGAFPIRADVNQVKQILMNLCVNAQDAMPQGGKLTIAIRQIEVDKAYAEAHPGTHLGPGVLFSVSDTGVGMDQETICKAFEPFFTTKEDGTGLGLATVYGIVRQHGGHIRLHSMPGAGTTAEVLFRKAASETAERRHAAGHVKEIEGGEIILVVEDNDSVRELVCAALEKMSYRVLRTKNGEECVALMGKCECTVDLLLTDVVMPGMNGRELHKRLSRRWPDLRVIYMSGYPEQVVSQHGVLEEGINFLQKPLSIKVLRDTVRHVLEAED
jgi:PAS domain S-box-containing protein